MRTVRLSKGGNPFCYPEHIEVQAVRLFDKLKGDSHLQDRSAADFSQQAAHFIAELNAIHAFREGNGRSQLTFLALLADHAGYPLDLDRLEPEAMLAAMIASFDGREDGLATVIRGLVD